MPSPGILAACRRRSVPAVHRRRRKATVVRDYLFLRKTKVAKYFNRTPWWVSVPGGFHSPLVVSVAPALPTAGLHPRPLRVHPGRKFHIARCAVYDNTHGMRRLPSAPFVAVLVGQVGRFPGFL